MKEFWWLLLLLPAFVLVAPFLLNEAIRFSRLYEQTTGSAATGWRPLLTPSPDPALERARRRSLVANIVLAVPLVGLVVLSVVFPKQAAAERLAAATVPELLRWGATYALLGTVFLVAGVQLARRRGRWAAWLARYSRRRGRATQNPDSGFVYSRVVGGLLGIGAAGWIAAIDRLVRAIAR